MRAESKDAPPAKSRLDTGSSMVSNTSPRPVLGSSPVVKASSPLYVEISSDGSVFLRGELDMATVRQLEESVAELIRAGRPLIVDMSQLTYIDSSGVGWLGRVYVATRERVVICNPSRQVRRVLELMDAGMKPIAWVTQTD